MIMKRAFLGDVLPWLIGYVVLRVFMPFDIKWALMYFCGYALAMVVGKVQRFD